VDEWDLSSSESDVEERNVKEDSDEEGLGEKSEVTEGVNHTLLSEGEVSGLADHQISPLHANDRYEIAGLSVFQSLGGVADWFICDMGVPVELWKIFIKRVESANGPVGWGSLVNSSVSVEKSDIHLSRSGGVPTKGNPVLLSIIDIGVTPLLSRFNFLWNKLNTVGISLVGVNSIFHIWFINVGLIWFWSFEKG